MQGFIWCRGRDSDSHGFKAHWILSPTCLPVPPPRPEDYSNIFKNNVKSFSF